MSRRQRRCWSGVDERCLCLSIRKKINEEKRFEDRGAGLATYNERLVCVVGFEVLEISWRAAWC